ncbi:MAG: hypothetical protein ABIK09_19100 [Pseudomonadota bacterium]
MTRALFGWFLLAGLAAAGSAQGQVFSGGDPSGFSLTPFTWIEPGQAAPTGRIGNGELRACTSGPNFMLIAGYRYDGIWAVGPSGMDDHALEVPILSMLELSQDPLFDEDDEILGMAATPQRDAVYVGFQPYYLFNACLPILRVELDGTWEVAFSCEELGAFAAGKIRVRSLATASDGTLFAVVVYEDEGLQLILRIDPAGPPQKRAEVILSSEELIERMPGLEPGSPSLLQLAADAEGRLFVLAQVTEVTESAFKEIAHVLLRLDPDGGLSEMTEREKDSAYTGVDTEDRYVARSCLDGILYDAADRMVVCGGHGNVFLIHPDVPRRSHLMISGAVVMNTLSAWSGKAVYSPPGGPGGPGGCLGDIGWSGHKAYGTFMGTYMMFSWDADLLDLDGDHLLGFEEAALGTDPFDPDSDGGGTCDGLEAIDYSDPQDGGDDRVTREPELTWTSPGLWFGSRAGNSTGSRHGIERFGVAAPDGSLLVIPLSSGEGLFRFTGWDEPLVPTGQTGSSYGHMAAGPDGSVFRIQPGWGVLRARPDGVDEVVLEDGEIRDLTGAEAVNVTGLAVQPDGAVIVGTGDGHLIAVEEDGGVALLYDAFEDFAAAGFWTEEDGCFGGIPCELLIGPITYEPVHGILFFWLTMNFIAGPGFMLDLVAVRPDGHLKIVADHWAFAESIDLLGGMDPLDMEPDMAGGLWVLGAGSSQRRLLHLDGRTLAPVTGMSLPQPLMSPGAPSGLAAFSHTWDLMVTPDGRIFASDGYFHRPSPPTFGLVEVKPVDDVIRGGDLLVVQPELATLSKLMPDGGGILLHQGEPFQQPTAVAAAGGRVAVGDAARGEILVSDLDGDGRLGPWTVLAPVGTPTGMDIDAEGRILVVDGPGGRLLRVAPDGGVEVLAEGDDLGDPLDVVATASGAAAVTDAGAGRLLRVSPTGQVTTLADLGTPGAVALVAGQRYVVASTAADTWPRTVGAGGALGGTGSADTSWDLHPDEAVGGLAAAPDGTAFLALVKSWSWDWKDPFPTLRVFRITTEGYVQPLVRYGLEVGAGSGDLCRVRGAGEPLPAEPGDAPLPMPVDEGIGESGGGGGCAVGVGPGILPALPVVALLLLLLVAARRGWTKMIGLILVVLLAACGGAGGGGAGDGDGADVWEPGTVPPECKGKDLCKPASAPVCEDGDAASKRCVSDEDGCWTWSETVSCAADAPCEEGVCGGPWCVPSCDPMLPCGADGCGGSCGFCAAPEVCCGGICSTCEADCAGRECGWDGATGACGECADDRVCVDGTCAPPGQAGCGEYLKDCLAHCALWDQLCEDECAAWLSPVGMFDVLALEGCDVLRCAPCYEAGNPACPDACLLQSCAEEYAACYNRNGTATCAETWACAEACGPDDQPCIDGCTDQATREATLVIIDLVLCLEAICPPDLPAPERVACEDAALLDQCAAQADPCFGPCEPNCPVWATCGPDGCTGLCGLCAEEQLCNGFECIAR